MKTPVPASFFAMVLGLVGLGGCWRNAASLYGLPWQVGEAIMAVAALVWVVLAILYAAKWIARRDAALAELAHPVQCCFISLVPISTMLMALVLLPYARDAAVTIFVAAAIATTAFALYRGGQLLQGGRAPETTTPVLYLPTVAGNFVAAIVAGALGWPEIGVFFLGAGIASWLAIESVILHRLYTAEPLPPALRPTLGIQLAPPTVGCAAYLSVTTGMPDHLAQALLGYGLLQALMLLRLLPWLLQQPFAASYWGFTFGVAALGLAPLRMVERGLTGPVTVLAPILFVMANVIIGAIAIGTLILAVRGNLLPAGATVTPTPPPSPRAVRAPARRGSQRKR